MSKRMPFIGAAIVFALISSGVMQGQATKQPHLVEQSRPNPPAAFVNYRAVTDDNSSCNSGHTNCSQQQPATAVNPTNPLDVVIAGKDWRPADGDQQHVWLYTTTDGGASWLNQPITYPGGTTVYNSTDGVTQWDRSGNVYVVALASSTAPSNKEGNYVARSTDGGLTWGAAVQVDSGGNDDKDWLAVDNNPASPYLGRLYVCWYDNLTHNNYCAHSANQGATWSAPTAVAATNLGYSYPVVQPDGSLDVFYNNDPQIDLVRSTDGGSSFGSPIVAATISSVYSNRSGRTWRVNTIPAAAAGPEGNLYLTWLDDRNENTAGWDIYFTSSADNGATWTTPQRVNDDSGNADQFEPAISVAPNGRVDLVFMDMRNDAGNTLADLYYATSSDGGQSFAANQRVSDVNFNLSDGIPTDAFQSAGDYLSVDSSNADVWTAWTDTRNSDGRGSHAEDAYAAHLHLIGTPTPSATAAPPSATPTLTGTPPTATPTATGTPPTNTPTATATPVPPTATVTNTPLPSNTPGGPTDTSLPSNTPTDTPTNPPPATGTPPQPTPTDCPNPFVDLQGNVFYPAIHTLACAGVINGIDATHYGPAGISTRGQFAKVVVLGFGLPFYTPTNGPTFTDVPPSYFAYLYIETGYQHGILSGFDAASCVASDAIYPCYLPNLAISRAQLTKLVVNAAHYPLVTPGAQTFSDVPPSNVFYIAIETAHAHGVINGFPDGSFRPNQSIRRDEMAQIVYAGTISP